MSSLPTALTIPVGGVQFVRSKTVDAYGLSPTTTPVIWSTSNAAIATVSPIVDPNSSVNTGNAMILGISAGSATITATAGSTTATFALTVATLTPGAAANIDISADQSYNPKKR